MKLSIEIEIDAEPVRIFAQANKLGFNLAEIGDLKKMAVVLRGDDDDDK